MFIIFSTVLGDRFIIVIVRRGRYSVTRNAGTFLSSDPRVKGEIIIGVRIRRYSVNTVYMKDFEQRDGDNIFTGFIYTYIYIYKDDGFRLTYTRK